MRPKLTDMGQMDANGSGKSMESHSLIGLPVGLSSMEGVLSWFGDAWDGMGMETCHQWRER